MKDTHIIPRASLPAMGQKKVQSNPLFKNIIHFGASWSRVRDVVKEVQPDIVGITCMFSPFYRQAYFTAEIVRQESPSTKIFMGGPHPTVAWVVSLGFRGRLLTRKRYGVIPHREAQEVMSKIK